MHHMITCPWSAIDLFWYPWFGCNVLVNLWAWGACSLIKKSSSRIGEISNFVELVCFRDVGTLLFDKDVPMRSGCVKIVVCQKFCHVILMLTPTPVTYIGMYEFILHVWLHPWICIYICVWILHLSWTLWHLQKKKDYTSCCTHGHDDQIYFLCLCVPYAGVPTSVNMWNSNMHRLTKMQRHVRMRMKSYPQTCYVVVQMNNVNV